MKIIMAILSIAGVAFGVSVKVQYIDLNDYDEIVYNNSGDGFIAYDGSDRMEPDNTSSNANLLVYTRGINDEWAQLGSTIIETNQYIC